MPTLYRSCQRLRGNDPRAGEKVNSVPTDARSLLLQAEGMDRWRWGAFVNICVDVLRAILSIKKADTQSASVRFSSIHRLFSNVFSVLVEMTAEMPT